MLIDDITNALVNDLKDESIHAEFMDKIIDKATNGEMSIDAVKEWFEGAKKRVQERDGM